MFFKKSSILGINARNLLYIRPFNREKSVEIADDKLKTKAFLSARGIPVPKLLGAIRNYDDLSKFNFKKVGNEFVLKPNHGFGGNGIIPIFYKTNENFISSKQKTYTEQQLINHIKDILAGNFSINDNLDQAFFEKLINTDEILGKYTYEGLPDIRVIVHKLVPVMAMLRLPTRESNGKANLHQGAIGAGIDLAKGEITHLIHKNSIINEIPGLDPIKGLKIPFWEDILRIACQAQLASNLGYLGADIAIDKHQGPILLEINARAGIGIQLANQAPLKSRLEKLDELNINNIEKGIRIAKDMFGYSIEKGIKNLSGKKVLGLFENIEIYHLKQTHSGIAFLNTSRRKNYLSIELAKQLGLIKSKKDKNIDQKFKLKFKIGKTNLTSLFKIDKSIKKKYQVIIGNRDLSGRFLIDTGINNLISEKNSGSKQNIFITSYDPIETDRLIYKIGNQIKLLSNLRPTNFKEESQKFINDKNYAPQFIYKPIQEEFEHLSKELAKVKYDDTDLGRLFMDKVKELESFISLINSRGTTEFSEISSQIFGSTSLYDFEKISKQLNEKEKRKIIKTPHHTAQETKQIFEETLIEYGLKDWRVVLSDKIIAKCVTNKNKKILLKTSATFSEARIKDLIIHEIETHLLTAENGSRQKYKLFNLGFANFLETQEGLAIYNAHTQSENQLEESHKEILTLAIYYAKHMSISELYDKIKAYKLTKNSTIDICLRVKRGLSDTSLPGAFTKDYSYYKGKLTIQDFVKNGGDIRDLYHGKYNLNDLTAIKAISQFKIPPILPKWLK